MIGFMKLYDQTMVLLDKSSMSKKEISEQSSVSERWLYNLASGESQDLSVTKVQRVYDFLSSQESKTAA